MDIPWEVINVFCSPKEIGQGERHLVALFQGQSAQPAEPAQSAQSEQSPEAAQPNRLEVETASRLREIGTRLQAEQPRSLDMHCADPSSDATS